MSRIRKVNKVHRELLAAVEPIAFYKDYMANFNKKNQKKELVDISHRNSYFLLTSE
jgi:hypothetical protein